MFQNKSYKAKKCIHITLFSGLYPILIALFQAGKLFFSSCHTFLITMLLKNTSEALHDAVNIGNCPGKQCILPAQPLKICESISFAHNVCYHV